jgi:hypothetical protein
MFNKYKWIEEQEQMLREYILESIKNDNSVDAGDLAEQLNNDIENDVIYYNDCWEICKGIAPNSEWDKMELGPITSIRELAFATLYEFAYENINLDKLLEETYKEIEDAKF